MHHRIFLSISRVPPREFKLLKWGENRTRKGTFTLTKRSALQIMKAYSEHNSGDRPILIDWEHGSLRSEGRPDRGRAAGWADLELRSDGIWLARIEWKPLARECLTTGEVRYFSPAFDVNQGAAQVFDPPTNEIVEVINCALTNNPATDKLPALVAASRFAQVECVIKHQGNKWVLYDSSGKKKLGEHASEADAKKQEAAINISKARAAGHKIPKKKSARVANRRDSGTHGSSATLAREKPMKQHPMARHLKHYMTQHEMDHESCAKKMGLSHERMKKLTAGHPPTQEEMKKCSKHFSAKAMKSMGFQPKHEDGDEHHIENTDDEEHEEHSMDGQPVEQNKVPHEASADFLGGLDEADENQNGQGPDESDADETNEEPTVHASRDADDEEEEVEEEEEVGDDVSPTEALVMLTGHSDPARQRTALREMKRKATMYDRTSEAVERLSRENEDRERRELILLAREQGKITDKSQEMFWRKQPVATFREWLKTASRGAGQSELQPLVPSAIKGVSLSREEIQINELTGGNLDEYAAFKRTMQGAPSVDVAGTRVTTTLSRAVQQRVTDSFLGRIPAGQARAEE